MFFKTLDYIRKKPPHVRTLFALITSLLFTFAVGLIWTVSYAEFISESTKDNFKSQVFEPFNKIGAIFGEGVGHIVDLGKGLGKEIESIKPAENPVSTTTDASFTSAEELVQ